MELLFNSQYNRVKQNDQSLRLFKGVKGTQIFSIKSISFENFRDTKDFFKVFLNIIKSNMKKEKHVFIFLDRIETDEIKTDERKIKLLLSYFSVDFIITSYICPVEIYENEELRKSLVNKKNVYFNSRLPIEKETVYLFWQRARNEKINEVFTKFCFESNQNLWSIIQNAFSRVTYKTLDFNSTIEQVYNEMNWPNDTALDLNINLYECALLADCSKMKQSSLNKIERRNWVTLRTSEEYSFNNHGYFGVAFSKTESDHELIAIAHRGTQFDKFGNIMADIQILHQQKPNILNEARAYENAIIKEHPNKEKKLKVVHIGFSLGGFIAASCATQNSQRVFQKYAITLDAPGIVLNQYDKKEFKACSENIVNYFLRPNVVNTCNQHVGRKFEISSNIEQPSSKITKIDFNSSTALITQELEYTLESHNLDLILDLTKDYRKVTLVEEWPIANNQTTDNWSHERDNTIVYSQSN
jgi:hypothetical protein